MELSKYEFKFKCELEFDGRSFAMKNCGLKMKWNEVKWGAFFRRGSKETTAVGKMHPTLKKLLEGLVLGWISRNFRTLFLSLNCHFWAKIANSHYRNGHFQDNRVNRIKGEFVKNPGIHFSYNFWDFRSKILIQVLKFLGIQPRIILFEPV